MNGPNTMTVEEYKELVAKGFVSDKKVKAAGPKFQNQKTTAGGVAYDSKGEASRGAELDLMVRAGEIKELCRQVKFALVVNDIHICDYVADFVYFDLKKACRVVEDYKSPPTRKLPAYRIKKKLMQACLGIEIVEVS